MIHYFKCVLESTSHLTKGSEQKNSHAATIPVTGRSLQVSQGSELFFRLNRALLPTQRTSCRHQIDEISSETITLRIHSAPIHCFNH